jgi:hypothetical protein
VFLHRCVARSTWEISARLGHTGARTPLACSLARHWRDRSGSNDLQQDSPPRLLPALPVGYYGWTRIPLVWGSLMCSEGAMHRKVVDNVEDYPSQNTTRRSKWDIIIAVSRRW